MTIQYASAERWQRVYWANSCLERFRRCDLFCGPLVFVLLIVAGARYPAMDAFTMKLPAGFRTAVADLTLRNTGFGKDSAKGIDRAINLDPENVDAWARRCHGNDDETTYDQAACRKAIAFDPSPWNYNGLGATQEKAKDFCSAEDSYTNAIKGSSNNALFLRNMARAALRCGHLGAGVAGFEVAEGLDAKAAATPDEDDDGDVKADLLSDRQYLAVVYNLNKEPTKSAAICAKAHPGWKSCYCELTETDVKCSDTIIVSASKK
jgi:tetratricopeptide (TPR) repeat protein